MSHSHFDKDSIREALSITELIEYYGARHVNGDAYHCFRHDDRSPSLIANAVRGVTTCESQKCDIKRGSDIFAIIMLVENVNFQKAKERAAEIAVVDVTPRRSTKTTSEEPPRTKESNDEKFSVIPETVLLENKHKIWLKSRYGDHWRWLVDRFDLRGWHYHIAAPITKETMVFIPLDKYTKTNLSGDHIFYRGPHRTTQVFSNRPEEHQTCTNIFVCEGEKDVMQVELEMHRKGVLGEWGVITNTIGAGNLKADTALFKNFDPSCVQKVLICYDHDDVGKQANAIAQENAANYFSQKTQITIHHFPKEKPKGYDIGDYLAERGRVFSK